MSAYTYRAATADDGATILRLVTDLAIYEKAEKEVIATAEDFNRALSQGSSALLVEDARGIAVGFALWFPTFSTWLGRPGMFLEDLYVVPEHRGRGLGVGLLARLAACCKARGYLRFEWRVLDWNRPSIDFYEALGAKQLSEWYTYRLEGEAMELLAQRCPANFSAT
jgi:GNAT superfamily N-acetyltransferase